MEVTDIDQLPMAPVTAAPDPTYEQCDQCGAPVESSQRYCVVCGVRRRGAYDPAARYLSHPAAKARPPATPPPGRRRAPGLGFALVLAMIPLAVGLGVLVGRSSTNGDQKLIAALRQQKPEVISGTTGVSAGPAQNASTVAARQLQSNFPLQTGYTVELQTLPAHGTTQAAVDSAERAARQKGAKAVGLITQSDFHVTPAPPSGAYVIYAGAYHARSQAQAELAKLHHSFPKAVVVQIRSTSAVAGAGKVLAKTAYGTAHQIAGFKATPAQLAQGKQIVNKVAKQIGNSYVNAQKGLPDQISVP